MLRQCVEHCDAFGYGLLQARQQLRLIDGGWARLAAPEQLLLQLGFLQRRKHLWQRRARSGRWWLGSSTIGGGIVIDGGLHWLRPLRMFLEADGDRVVSVVAATADHLEEELAMEGETSAHAILRTQHGRLATFRATLGVGAMAHSLSPFFRVTGRAGELVISGTGLQGPDGGSLTAFRAYQQEGGGVSTAAPATEQEVLVAEGAGSFGRGFGNLWEDFIGVVARGDAAAAQDNVDEATRDVVLATAIYQSAKERKWIELSPLIKEAGLC